MAAQFGDCGVTLGRYFGASEQEKIFLLLVQRIVDLVSNGATYSWHFRQLFSARTSNTRWTAKVHEQLPSPFRTNTHNLLQLALIAFFATSGAVS